MNQTFAVEQVPDVQNRIDARGVALDQVGVSGLRCPICIVDSTQKMQLVTATTSMSVDLPHQVKGTHMSRFVEVLNEYRSGISFQSLPAILESLRQRLSAETAQIELRFFYFLERSAPVTGLTGLLDYECSFEGRASSAGCDLLLEVTVPLTSLCPCSKEISDYGAHNQRGLVKLRVQPDMGGEHAGETLWIEDLVELVEQCGSSPVFPVLKRADERWVTMRAYENPVFVEDIVRAAAVRLKNDLRVAWFSVEATNIESIHNHNAFAKVTWRRGAA